MSKYVPLRTAEHNLRLFQLIALAPSVAGGFAIWYLVWPFQPLLAVIAALASAGGMLGLWHVLLGLAAQSKAAPNHTIAVAFGIAFVVISAGVSSWGLTTAIGGPNAKQELELEYVEDLTVTRAKIVANTALDRAAIDAVGDTSGNLATASNAELIGGFYSQHPGKGNVYASLNNAAKAFARKADALNGQQRERADDLEAAQVAIHDAENAAGARDDNAFSEAVGKAVSMLTAANEINVNLADLDGGLTATEGSREAIRDAIAHVGNVKDGLTQHRRIVTVPLFHRVDERQAVIDRPPVAAWAMSLALELIPLLGLGLTLFAPRHGEDPREDGDDDDALRFNGGESVTPMRPRRVQPAE